MYDITEMKLVYTSKGLVLLLIDEDGDFVSFSPDKEPDQEAIDKYNRRDK